MSGKRSIKVGPRAQIFEKARKLRRQRRLEGELLACPRMSELEAVSMEKVSAQVSHRGPEVFVRKVKGTVATVENVSNDRVPCAGQMDADLVCPAGFNADAQERKWATCVFFAVVSHVFAFAT